MAKLIKIEKFTDDDKNPTIPINSTYQYVTIFGEDDYIETEVLYSEDGWDIDTDKTSLLYYDDDEITATEDNPNREPAGSADGVGGQFASKDGGGSVSEYKETTMKDVETKPEVKEIQKKLDRNVTNKVEDAIKELGIR